MFIEYQFDIDDVINKLKVSWKNNGIKSRYVC